MSSSLKKLLNFTKRNPKAVQSALRASAAPPSSGFAFIDNSQGSSAAMAELSVALDDLLQEFDLDGPLKPQMQLLAKRLDEEGSRYCNSRINDEECEPWSCTQQEARLISIAWKCANGAYGKSESLDTTAKTVQIFENCTLTQSHIVTPTSDGTVKSVVFTTVSPRDSYSYLLPMLVVAIRGSASSVDHMVNANGNPRNVKDFIDFSRFYDHGSETGFQAHSGFLGCTTALDLIVSRQIHNYTQENGSKNVLFTGHSAGGAVASLVFLRNLSRHKDGGRSMFSCITFGAPPTVSAPISLDTIVSSSKGLCLNIINEFDLVARADKPYILSLVNLIRTMYGQPPLPGQSIDSTTSPSSKDPGRVQDSVSSKAESSQVESEERVWPVPRAALYHVGPRIILRRRLEGEEIRLQAVNISQEAFQKLLFCGLAVHKRDAYESRLKSLADGQFNGADGWTL